MPRREAGTSEAIGFVLGDVRNRTRNRSRRAYATEAPRLEVNRNVNEWRIVAEPQNKSVEGTKPEVHFYEERQSACSTSNRLIRDVPTCSELMLQEWRTTKLVAIVSTELFSGTALPRVNECERSDIERLGSGINSFHKKTLRISEG